MGVVLRAAEHGAKLGQRRADDGGAAEKRPLYPPAAEQPCQLLAHALRGDKGEAAGLPLHGGGGVLLDREAKLGGKAHRAQDAQGVLGEAHIGVSDRAEHAVFKVLPAAERVEQAAFRVPRHRADREIAPREIVPDTRNETHAVRVTAVRIAAVRTEGGDFEGAALGENSQGSVTETGLNEPFPRENAQHFLGTRRGTQVEIVRLRAAQAVAHTAADRPCLEPGVFEAAERPRCVFRQAHHVLSFSCFSL